MLNLSAFMRFLGWVEATQYFRNLCKNFLRKPPAKLIKGMLSQLGIAFSGAEDIQDHSDYNNQAKDDAFPSWRNADQV